MNTVLLLVAVGLGFVLGCAVYMVLYAYGEAQAAGRESGVRR